MHDHHEIGTVPPDEADPSSAPSIVIGAIGVILTLVIIVMLQVLYYQSVESEHYRKVIAVEPEELRTLQAAQAEQLKGGRWIDQAAGVATIPIEDAMERVAAEASQRRELGQGSGSRTPSSR